MAASNLRSMPTAIISAIAIIVIIIFITNPPNVPSLQLCSAPASDLDVETLGGGIESSSLYAMENSSPHAYVTFFQDHYKHDNSSDDVEDEYFVSTRVLAYQSMYSPKTGTNTSIPFVVICTPLVRESKKERLEQDGAIVITVDFIENPDWMKKAGVMERWATVMTKMRIFQLTQFEKILLLDSDIFVIDRLDAIFQDTSTEASLSRLELATEEDVGKLPKEYMMAGQGQQKGWKHPYPPSPDEEMYGAGFFLTTPSEELFQYYMHVLYDPKPRFDPQFPEQNLMNYAHRRDGPMPWQDVYYKWTTTFPTIAEYNAGAKSLHHKFWWDDTNTPDHGLNKLTAMWWRVRGEMEGYYYGLEG